jgi:hypothetical protein
MKPDPRTRALTAIVRDLIGTRDGATYFAERVWNVSLHYDLGSDHPLVGRSAPDFALEDGRRLGALLRDGNGVLLDFDRHPSLRALDGRWGDRVRYVASDAEDRLGLSALLVRPDGFVAWASDATPDVEAVTRAAERWFTTRALWREKGRLRALNQPTASSSTSKTSVEFGGMTGGKPRAP